MARVIRCPNCEASLKIPAEMAGSGVRCRSCGHKFRVPEKSTRKRAKPADDEYDEYDEYAEQDAAAARSRSRSGRRRKKKPSKNANPLHSFLRPWLIACGAVMGVTLLIGLGGLASEIVAMVASGICVAAAIGCVLVGRTWMSIDLGKESMLQGVASFFIPLVGVALTVANRGPSMRGLVVYVSAIAPALLGLAMVSIYERSYTGAGRAAVRVENATDMINKLEEKIGPDAPVKTGRLKVISNTGEMPNLQAKCEPLLSQFDSYVTGSLKVDVAANTLTFEYRGPELIIRAYGMFLGNSTKTIMTLDK